MIVQELYAIQSRHGYLPRGELEALADRLALPLYRVQEVASFFPHYRLVPPPACEVHVCRDMACALRGSAQILQELQARLSGRDDVAVRFVSCIGRCDRAPAVRMEQHQSGSVGHGSIQNLMGRSSAEILSRIQIGDRSRAGQGTDSDASYACCDADKWRINVYSGQAREAHYESIRRFVAAANDDTGYQSECDRVIRELEAAGLLGMGGAGGRTYKKWSEVLKAAGERKYVVCNADESEPGTFKDRELLLRVPHLVLEGVILAGLLLRADRGYVYIRHEYEEQIAIMESEIAWATQQGLCGENILGSGRSFQVQVFVSPGGYICGEQTALVQAIEDKRAEPRNRPPELQTNGLWDMPTLLNNVETLAWVPAIVLKEGAWYAKQSARQEFRGARFFSVSGDVARPGVYEVPIGIKLGQLIDEYCGGMRQGETLKAVALSGPSGGFLPARLPLNLVPASVRDRLPQTVKDFDLRELELDVALFRKWNLMLGAGIVVYGASADMLQQANVCLEFYRSESCGKCVPCRIGSTKFAEIGHELQAGECSQERLVALQSRDGVINELASTMRQTSICGLGTVASNPLTTLLTHFANELPSKARITS